MSEQSRPEADQVAAVVSGPSRAGADGASPGAGSGAGGSKSIAESLPVGSELAQERPEVLVGGAFVVGFLVGRILKHVTSD